jgi:hypothetical protein
VIAHWWTWLPICLVAAAWAATRWRDRRQAARRRPAAPGITDGIEAHIAVGSLAHVAPSDIEAHVLLVVTRDGCLGVSGTGCGSLRALILAKASAAAAAQEFAAHGHGGER